MYKQHYISIPINDQFLNGSKTHQQANNYESKDKFSCHNTDTCSPQNSRCHSPIFQQAIKYPIYNQGGISKSKEVKQYQNNWRQIRGNKEDLKSSTSEKKMKQIVSGFRNIDIKYNGLDEIEKLRAQIAKQKRDKNYWKNLSLKLEQENKVLKKSEQQYKNAKIDLSEKIKINMMQIEKRVNEKLEIQRQLLKLQTQNKEYLKKIQQYENKFKTTNQNFANNSDTFSIHHHKKNVIPPSKSRQYQEKKDVENKKKIIKNQQETIQNLNQELVLTKIKLLELKYAQKSLF